MDEKRVVGRKKKVNDVKRGEWFRKREEQEEASLPVFVQLSV